MSLLDQITGTQPSAEPQVKKQSYGARMRQKQIEAARCVKSFLDDQGITLPEDVASAMDVLLHVRKPAQGSHGPKGTQVTPVLYKLFGNEPKVGDTVTAQQMFERTFKGFQEMRQQMRKWEAKGIKVEYSSEQKVFTLNTPVAPWHPASSE